MDAREELALEVQTAFNERCSNWGTVAEALLVAGYRKMPDREAVTNLLHQERCADDECDGGDLGDFQREADAILALIDGNK